MKYDLMGTKKTLVNNDNFWVSPQSSRSRALLPIRIYIAANTVDEYFICENVLRVHIPLP